MKARPAVLHLIKGLGIGGAERLVAEGARHWDRASFDYAVAYLLPWKDQLVPALVDQGIDVTCLGHPRRGVVVATPLRVRRFVERRGFDLVHVHSPSVAAWCRLLLRPPLVYTEHNVLASYRLPTRLVDRWTYPRDAASVAVSDAVADSVAATGLPRPRVIPNGVACTVTAEEIARARDELRLAPDDPLVVHVGNVRPGKGHRNLVAAARTVLRSRADVTFVSLGVEKHPGDLDRLRAEATDLGERFRFLGRRPDAWAFIAAADVFVNPSEVEGLPLAVLEAMHLGTPVVATAAGGVPSVVHDGETGRLVPVGDPDALAEALLSVLRGDGPVGEWTIRARSLVGARFGLERMVRAYEDVYREALGA